MRFQIPILSGILVGTLLLSGCGGAKTSSTPTAANTQTAAVDLCAQVGGIFGRSGMGRPFEDGNRPISAPLPAIDDGTSPPIDGQLPGRGFGGTGFDAAGMQEYQALLTAACADGTADAAETAALEAKRVELGLPAAGQMPGRGQRPGQSQ